MSFDEAMSLVDLLVSAMGFLILLLDFIFKFAGQNKKEANRSNTNQVRKR